MSRRKPIFHMLLRDHNELKCFGVIGFMKWWQRWGRVGELVTLHKYIWKIYQLSKRFVYYWYLVMGIPQSQVTSEFSWDRDIYVEPWCFLCCKPERDVEQTVVWSVKWDSLTSSWYTVIMSRSIDQCNGMIPNRTKAIAQTNGHPVHWTVISETIKKGGYYSWIRDGMETRSTLLWSAPE